MSGIPATVKRNEEAARRLERLGLTGDGDDWAERYFVCEHLVDPQWARPRQRFEAAARSIRDLLAHRWVETKTGAQKHNPKRVYYLSMEFLIGRTLTNNIINLMAEPVVQEALQREGLDLHQLAELEPDAGLGNGGLGRLAACFIDSMATLQYSGDRLRPALRIRHLQAVDPQRLPGGAARQLAAPARPLGGRPAGQDDQGAPQRHHPDAGRPRVADPQPAEQPARHRLRPAGGRLRRQVRQHAAAVGRRQPRIPSTSPSSPPAISSAPCCTTSRPSRSPRVLYPDDSTEAGRTLRFLQEYFLVCCSLDDIVSRFRKPATPTGTTCPTRSPSS